MKFPALFIDKNSLYKNHNFDCYDEDRDALTFINSENKPIICHPPCRLFSKMRSFSKASFNERILAFYAIGAVRKYGGIVEHPEGSNLFKLTKCDLNGNIDNYGGFLRKYFMSDFGFPARKPTLLYFVGISPKEVPSQPLNFNRIEFTISSSKSIKKTGKKEINKKIRAQSPSEFIEFIYECLLLIYHKNQEL